jgi:hypothetical protein
MAKSRPEKTLADYVAIAISPLLIMALSGSLAFFLLELAYAGDYAERLRWILFWFVFASVLVGRIAVEQGSEHAALFGVGLAGATGLAAFKLAPDGAIPGLFVLAIIWWSVHRLTFDCTLIDDALDSTGEGLLQSSGLDTPDDEGAPRRKSRSWWKSLIGEPEGSRAPGTWVVYFSLAALPLFGIGQVLIPASQSERRNFAFFMLLIYVASALGLLLTTSFLGLRRYLRQRNLKMPASMAALWLGSGVSLIGIILGICLLLPRPDNSATPSDLWRQVADAREQASRFAQGGKEAGKGDGREIGEKPDDKANPEDKANDDQKAQQKNEAPREGKKETDPKGSQQKPGDGQPADQKEGDQKPGEQKQADQQGGEQQGEKQVDKQGEQGEKPQKQDPQAQKENPEGEQKPPDQAQQAKPEPQEKPENQQAEQQQDAAEQQESPALDPSEWFSWMGEHWRIVLWIVGGLIGGFFLIRNWTGCMAFLGRIWAEFLSLFGMFHRDAAEGDETPAELDPVVPLRPFSEMSNPFTSGDAQRMKPSELLRATFIALQAWAQEPGHPRRTDQTPLEFVQRLAVQAPSLAVEAKEVGQLFSRMAYAGQPPTRDDLDVMARLWRRMESAETAMSSGRG